jgi:hypothetical protein
MLILVNFAAGLPLPATAEVEDPRSQLVALAEADRWSEAEALARALLLADPRDVTVLIVLSRARRAAGDPAGARVFAARAREAATTDAERYVALTELAAAAHAEKRHLVAQFWLRGAVQVAPSAELRENAIRNYRTVAAENPWTVQLQFGLAPSSNVNNGSQAESLDIGGLDFVLSPDARALSGTELTAGVSAYHRLAGLGGLPARLGLVLAMQEVRLSGSARAAAPEADSDDYDQATVELRFDQALSAATAPLRWRVEARLGHSWYGGAHLSNHLRLGLGADWGDPARRGSSVALSFERQDRQDLDSRSADILRLDAGRQWRLGSGDLFALGLFLRQTTSQSVEVDHFASGLSASYDLGTVAGGAFTLATGMTAEWRDYDMSPYQAGGREDLRLRLSARIGFPRAETWGFLPEVTVEASETWSDVDLFDSQDVTVRLGVRSAF